MTIQFIPTEEQAMLRESVRRWGESRDPRHAEAFDETWAYAAEMGWLMAGLPEEQGGLGGSAYDTAIIAEELGRVLVRAPFAEIAGTAAQLLLRLDPDRVAAIAEGASRPILAHDEAEARGDRSYVTTVAVRSGEQWLLTGRKTAIVGAPHANVLLVSAQVEGQGITLFEIPSADAPLTAFTTIDDRAAAELRLSDTPAQLIGTVGAAMPALDVALDHSLVLQSAEAVGAMQRALEMTREYLQTRRQYGQVIGDFQALRHRLADMFIEVEQARSMVLRGIESLTDEASRSAMAAATKARVAQAGLFVTGHAIQLHGGIGVTDEYPLGHYFKRIMAFDQRHGNAAVQVQRFAILSAA
jgi:alkylation response protein AidB-like acyl-CoA dehydrogenase